MVSREQLKMEASKLKTTLKIADALRLHQNLNKPTNKPPEVVRKRSEMAMRIEKSVRWYSDGVLAVKDGRSWIDDVALVTLLLCEWV